MNLLFEFSDSEVGKVVQTDRGLWIRFSAAAALQIDPSSPAVRTRGFARNVEVLVLAATGDELRPEHIGRIAHGRLALSGRWLTQIPIPHVAEEPVTLELGFANHETLTAKGAGLECQFAGKPNFAESLFC